MDYILIISFIIIAALVYKLIDVVFDNASASLEMEDKEWFPRGDNALLFANKSFNKEELEELLKKRDLNGVFIEEINNLDTKMKYNYLIAAGDSDFDNITLCTICSKMLGVEKYVAICNYSYNKKIYEDNHIPYLFGSDINIISLALFLFK
ncbi:hypothetical protein E9840_11890 [Tissierella creatinini]|nr:hypothetical protein E9840_11890 [Tissierella creatinini]TJX59967.1 hypothetical protein E8P77_20765 [Soehngenia saccharolytica]